MGKILNFMKLSIKGTPIGLISALTDVGTMFSLGKFTNMNLDYRVYISSFLGMIVSFIGNYLWTFKHSNNPTSKTTKFIKFMINHIILTILHAKLVIFVINKINKSLQNKKKTNIFTLKDKNNVKLNNETEIIIKQTLAGVFYLINIFIMQYIF